MRNPPLFKFCNIPFARTFPTLVVYTYYKQVNDSEKARNSIFLYDSIMSPSDSTLPPSQMSSSAFTRSATAASAGVASQFSQATSTCQSTATSVNATARTPPVPETAFVSKIVCLHIRVIPVELTSNISQQSMEMLQAPNGPQSRQPKTRCKRIKQCDRCRRRKLKCGGANTQTRSCRPCARLSIQCTWQLSDDSLIAYQEKTTRLKRTRLGATESEISLNICDNSMTMTAIDSFANDPSGLLHSRFDLSATWTNDNRSTRAFVSALLLTMLAIS
jgi:hypothetical protein